MIERNTQRKVIALAAPTIRADVVGLHSKKKWKFNWLDIWLSKNADFTNIVYKITLDGEVQGLIAFHYDHQRRCVYVPDIETAPQNRYDNHGPYHVTSALFAIAALYCKKCSVDTIGFTAKTKLIDYYYRYLQATPLHLPEMAFFPPMPNYFIDNFIV